MAGASQPIDINVDDQDVKAALNALLARIGDLQPAFRDLGEALLNSTRARFSSQTAPDGSPWAALSPAYRKRKKKNKDKILTLDGYLSGTLDYQASPAELLVGTPREYGAAHQFGRPEINLKPRPFLGISSGDKDEILDLLREHLARAAQP